MPINITTAVDDFVDLVNNKKRISLEDAAKELGLPENIVNEWAVFLEEENILKIEYQFTNAFLVAKSKQESNKEDYEREIEIITRELEIMLAGLNKINIKHEIKLKDVDDIKPLIKKFKEKINLDNDVLYAQKFVLEYEINALLNKIKKLKSYSEENYNNTNREFNSIKKRKEIFDKNYSKTL
ncbi:MAG: hypothetical protein AABW45_02350 [Nanoarchaeota archaeon]